MQRLPQFSFWWEYEVCQGLFCFVLCCSVMEAWMVSDLYYYGSLPFLLFCFSCLIYMWLEYFDISVTWIVRIVRQSPACCIVWNQASFCFDKCLALLHLLALFSGGGGGSERERERIGLSERLTEREREREREREVERVRDWRWWEREREREREMWSAWDWQLERERERELLVFNAEPAGTVISRQRERKLGGPS